MKIWDFYELCLKKKNFKCHLKVSKTFFGVCACVLDDKPNNKTFFKFHVNFQNKIFTQIHYL